MRVKILIPYRGWQKGGEVVASTIYGISLSALFGIVFVYSRNSLAGSDNKKKALVLTGIMFFVLFLIPTQVSCKSTWGQTSHRKLNISVSCLSMNSECSNS